MGSVHAYETQAGRLFEVRYRKPDGKTARKAGFKLKRDAQAYIGAIEVSKLQGAYIAPSDGLSIVSILGEDWLAAHQTAVKASTYHSDESAWRIHVRPKWGARAVGSIRHTEVQAWISKLAAQRSPTTVARVRGVLAVILDGAVKDNRITTNPARELKLPRKTTGRRAYLSHQQVERLALESKYPDFVRFLAYTGLRWGEATGLKVAHVDRARRRLRIEENAVSVNGHVVVGTPKTHERRSVVYPAFLDDAIATASSGKSADALLWGDGVTHLTQGHAHKGWFMGAVMRVRAAEEKAAAEAKRLTREEPPIMPRVTPHDLRHTAASLAISAGANVKAVQRMLGHASAAMTLDRYADLFEDDLDGVAEALDAARRERLQR
ncbi:site-specific integrase [Cryobacterium sp. CG_9.6]|uniref:tyrosine-type recombinase/integrase n=1 Tax=Cryobacterium sp. CG_9.6 TaxID=2760710 RepID=UPI0024750395|nr:site-specific integrase [Cryobacterium sp. CG_9.6]MDH6238195.1 integrase [Cryobacterium sp. CG_9.6]